MTVAAYMLVWLVCAWSVVTELSYVSPSANARLYACVAAGYARKRQASRYAPGTMYETTVFRTLSEVIAIRSAPQIVDLACGRGHVALWLLDHPAFAGRIAAVDASAGMIAHLREAVVAKGVEFSRRLSIQQRLASTAIREMANVDVVVMLEAGEFMRDFETTIRGIGKALVPGGLLIMTRPAWPISLLFPFRSQSKQQLRHLLEREGFEDIGIHPWCWRYDIVLARARRLAKEA